MFWDVLRQIDRSQLETFTLLIGPILIAIATTLVGFVAYHKLKRTAMLFWLIMLVVVQSITSIGYFLIHNT